LIPVPKREVSPPAAVSFLGGLELETLMHYYQFNIGDYHSHTIHLSDIEDLAYRRMLDWCYLHEKPLPLDSEEIARQIRMRTHSASIAIVLQDFFEKREDGWIHLRVIQEILKTGIKSEKASASAKARWGKKDANALPTQSDSNATQDPLPITHNPLPNNKDAHASLSADGLPTCPHQEILLLYKKHLPHLTQPRVWEGSRQTNMRQRWRQAAKPSNYSPEGYKTLEDGLKWWDSFFGYIANDSTLAQGFKTKDRNWQPDLEWIVNATNFAKIIDGKYSK
jgi:uncharacterized protein YdaU (DUF1376 family)